MAKKSAKKKSAAVKQDRKKSAKQTMIKGTEPPSISEIDKVARSYMDVRDERMSLTEEEVEQKNKLAELMRKHKLDKYEFDNFVVTRTHSETDNVKVRTKKEQGKPS